MPLKLSSGHAIPTLGLGTFQATKPGEVGAAVKAAIKAGQRLIDCAAGYGNQQEIGEALKEILADGVCRRDELFIVSKLFQTHHVYGTDSTRCEESLNRTLSDLGLDYLDLFLMHWPFAFAEKKLEKPEGTPQPLRLPDGSPNPIWTIKMEYLATWKEMERFVASGKCKSIGVSNFTKEQLAHLLESCSIAPAVNQFEVHPYHGQRSLIEWCEARGIRVMGYSPLGSSADRSPPEHGCTLLTHPVVVSAAQVAGKTPAQVLIRWGLQRLGGPNFISIPKSSNPDRIVQNGQVLDWSLSDEAMASLDGLECGFRYFISYLKRPDTDVLWHDHRLETGTEADFVSSGG